MWIHKIVRDNLTSMIKCKDCLSKTPNTKITEKNRTYVIFMRNVNFSRNLSIRSWSLLSFTFYSLNVCVSLFF